MAIYRNINTTFWTDTKVADEFTPEDKYFMLYCLTNNYTNLCGCYEISIKQMSRDTGYNEETIEKLLDRFKNVHKIIFYNKENKEILIKNWYKYNWTKSEKLDKPLLKEIESIKTFDFKVFVANEYNKRDTVSIPYVYPMDTTVSVTVSDTINNNIKEKVKKFKKPTIEEIKKYCFEKGYNINAEYFIDYYESNGWKVGKNPMKDWKATIRTWNSRNKNTNKEKFEQRQYDDLSYLIKN